MTNSVDPQWAWDTYQPSDGKWSRRDAAHLFRRAAFGASIDSIDQAVIQSPESVVKSLVEERSESAAYSQTIDRLAKSVLATGDVKNLPAWWTYRLLTTSDVLREKLTLFWHGHFATSGEKVTEPDLMLQQNELLRQHAVGGFTDMVHGIARDPAMLIYLDSATNRKAHPNENFARELMELFCLGEGRYTETDIRELARCFTGWEIRNDRFRFNQYQHDNGSKDILGVSGELTGEQGIEVVLKQPSVANFIVGKLVRFFVFDEPEPANDLIEPLTKQFSENGFQIAPVVQRILSSNLFFSKHAVGRKIRSPIEFAVGILRSLHGSTDLYALAAGLTELGQTPFFPPNVKGWDGGRTWINSSTLLARANLIRNLLDRKETRFAQGTLADFHDKHDLKTPGQIVDFWEDHLLAVSLPSEIKRRMTSDIDAAKGSRDERLKSALHLFCTLPEFQLS